MSKNNTIIGVLGYGNFGKVVCNTLFPDNPIFLFSQKKDILLPKHITPVQSLKELAEKADIIIPCVPIRNFEEVIQLLVPFLRERTIVMDICSIKEYPVKIMEKNLPKSTEIIATHPMFGPNSIHKRGGILKDLPLVIWNVSAKDETFENIKRHFQNLSLDVITMSPSEHDQLSAKSQFFALSIGEMAQELNLKPTTIDTPGARAIFESMKYMGADRHILEDMVTYNTYCQPVLKDMIGILESIQKGNSND